MGFLRNSYQNIHEAKMIGKAVYALLVVLALFLLSCCKGTKQEENPGEMARNFVQCMVEEKFDDCVNMMASSDSASVAYKDNMRTLFKQKVFSKRQTCGKLEKVEILQTDGNKERGYANVFLRLAYKDSTVENIVIPVVWVHDQWYIR